MNSLTTIRYGSRVRRHGRSRAARAYQARSFLVNRCAVCTLGARGVDERGMRTQDTSMRNAECGMANAEYQGERRRPARSRLVIPHSAFRIPHSLQEL